MYNNDPLTAPKPLLWSTPRLHVRGLSPPTLPEVARRDALATPTLNAWQALAMVSTAELTSMKGVLEGALTQCVTETIKAKPANPVLFLAHRLIQYAQMPPVDPLKAAAPSKPAASKAAEPAADKPKRRTSKAWAPNQSLAQDAKTTLEHNSKLDIYSQAVRVRVKVRARVRVRVRVRVTNPNSTRRRRRCATALSSARSGRRSRTSSRCTCSDGRACRSAG